MESDKMGKVLSDFKDFPDNFAKLIVSFGVPIKISEEKIFVKIGNFQCFL